MTAVYIISLTTELCSTEKRNIKVLECIYQWTFYSSSKAHKLSVDR